MREPTSDLDAILADAHLPTLLMCLVHLTGDASLLTDERRAVYSPELGPLLAREGGYPPAVRADLKARAKGAIEAHLAGAPPPAPPSPETVRRMMDFIAGAPIPDRYVPFLMDELGLGGVDTKTPRWDSPALREAAGELRAVIVGAGMSGLLMGYRLKQAGVSFTILEKNADVGGTWLENVYPGCRVDNPNHMYSYSFEPSHDFPYHFSPQPVLLDYFRAFADKHGLRPHIRFETAVDQASFDEAEGLWRIEAVAKDGARQSLAANALITAVGQLNRPLLPDIEGLESFAGPAFHSARWREDVDLAGKRIAVIGTGASAFQFVPEIAPEAANVTVFQRTPPWLVPAPHYHEPVPAGMRWLLEHVPFYDKWYRFWLFWSLTDGVYEAVKGEPGWSGPSHAVSEANAAHRELLAQAIRAQAPERPDLLAHLVPEYPFGGKRPLIDNGVWIGALKRDNVSLVTEPIARVRPDGVETGDGALHPADVMIFGTGFQASRFLWPMRITGRGGVDLATAWKGDPRAYLGMTAPGFPNLFILYGPNTNIVVNGSIIFFSECSVRYIAGALKLLAETGARAMEVRREVHDAFNARVDTANAAMAWGSPIVTSWYKNAAGRVTQNWPFPIVDYWTATVTPNPADFILTSDKNAAPA